MILYVLEIRFNEDGPWLRITTSYDHEQLERMRTKLTKGETRISSS